MEVYSTHSVIEPQDKHLPGHSNLHGRKESVDTQQSNPEIKPEHHAQPEITEPNYPKFSEIAKQVREKLQIANAKIQFEVSETSGRMIIKVMDPVSGEVIRKIPPEEVLSSARAVQEFKHSVVRQGFEVDVKY
jgi:uncharacterized FlaG/YvyC family protein